MNTPATDRLKVCAEHQQRVAYVYVRQSSMRQVRNNVESQKLQYGFAEQAAQLGWSRERIIVVDEDQGQSGALLVGQREKDDAARAQAVGTGKIRGQVAQPRNPDVLFTALSNCLQPPSFRNRRRGYVSIIDIWSSK